MPIIRSAKKRVKQTAVRTERRRPFRTRMLTLFKNMMTWINEKNTEKMEAHASETFKAIDTAAKKNIINKGHAARKKSKIQKALNEQKVTAKSASKTAKKAPAKKAAAKPAAKKAAPKAAAKKAPAKKPAAKKTTAKKAEK